VSAATRHASTASDDAGGRDGPDAELIAVDTQPDRPAGRGKKLAAGPVKALALEHQIPVCQPATLRAEPAQAELAALAPDVVVVVAYGLILPAAVLALPRLGCINVHGSVLPRWRGAAPIQRAIEAGDSESGVTIMQMDAGLDTGAMLTIARCAIAPDDTAGSLQDKLAALGPPALLQTLTDLAAGRAQPQAQDDAHSCYAAKIDKAEAALDWRRDAVELERRVRAFNPFPLAHATLAGERLKIHRARSEPAIAAPAGTIVGAGADGIAVACGSGGLRILELQLPGGRVLSSAEMLNGRAELFAPGRRFDHA
jgi:methionyl-tRNA formyltransferase